MNVYGTRSEDLDDDTLAKAEREALQRPSNSAMWDSRLYSSHAPVIGWAERGDDLLSESNYLMVLQALQAEAGWTEHEDQDCCWTSDGQKIGHGHDFEPHDDDVIDATISDWLVGSLRQVFVRVREAFCATCGLQEDEDGDWPDTGEPSDGHWHQGDFTRSWRAAVAIGLGLQDYPVFDESDFSEREFERFESDVVDALNYLESHEDDEALAAGVRSHLENDETSRENLYQNGYGGQDAWSAVEEEWKRVKDLICVLAR